MGKSFRAVVAAVASQEISVRASALAFTTVLSLVPLLVLLFSVFRSLGGLEFVYRDLEPLILESLSEGTGEIVAQHVRQFVAKASSVNLSWAVLAGLLVTAVLTQVGVAQALQKIWGYHDRPRLVFVFARSIIVLVALPTLASASIALTAVLSTQLKHSLPAMGYSIGHMTWMIPCVLNYALLVLVYTLVPWKSPPIGAILWGAALPAGLLELAKASYAFYTAKVVSYSVIYGAFASVPLLFIWIYLGWVIVLGGALWVKWISKLMHRRPS